ncbi:hypothetical protein Cgig2_009990 [Carnegiea gigantea]|uniref:NPF family transporter n=1 Tax=Carnegiea gigantea TaxID=171969 RepID=A0A9Q1Q822_9CARY|nr:hypothetical protein Cgig2_009990 [Carnegiea gigantea]
MAIEDGITEEKVAFLHKDDKLELQPSNSRRKGGLRTMPFIFVNESFEKVASYGLLPNMIFYLMNEYHVEAASGSIILSLWSAASNTMAIFGAFLSDSYLGRFRVIALGTCSSLLDNPDNFQQGMTLLWMTSMFTWMKPSAHPQFGQGCESATSLQFLVLYTSFALISIGAGCVRPCSIAFGADQVNNRENPNNERVLDSFFQWYYASTGLATVIALTLVVYIQDQFGWRIGFGVPASLMVLSLIAFLLGSPLYVHVPPEKNLFLGLIQVPVAAFQKRKINLSVPEAVEHYFNGSDSNIRIPIDKLRCLNKACYIVDGERELNPDGSAKDPWSLSTVEQVESLKAILRLMPLWSTGIMMLVVVTNTFTTLQAKIMDRHITSGFEIPAGSFSVLSVVIITIWIAFYDRVVVPLLAKYCGMPLGPDPRIRMALGLLLSCIAMIIAGVVESIRRKMAIDNGMEDQPNAVFGMSAMWLAPQLVLVGFAEGTNSVAQMQFYYAHLSKSMYSLAMAMFTLGMAVANLVGGLLIDLVDVFSSAGGKESWLSTNLDKGHLDYYYFLLAFLGFINFLYFLICCRVYDSSEGSVSRRLNDAKKEDSGCTPLPST